MADLIHAVEAAELLAQRRDQDALALMQLYPHQGRFLDSTKSEAWLFGANRSGKTDALAMLVSSLGRFGVTNPRTYYGNGIEMTDKAASILLVSLTFPNSRDVLQPKIFRNGYGTDASHAPFIPDSEILSWNATNQTLRTKIGTLINFRSCDAGPETFQGYERDLIGFDEVPHKQVYREATIRVGGGRRLLIRGAATILPPAGVPGGVAWIYEDKVAPWKEAGRNEKSPNLDIFTASIYDNPAIGPDEVARLESIYPVGSPEYLIRLKGELLPSIGGALVYPGFDRQFHLVRDLAPLDEDGRPVPLINPMLPLCLCVDFNPENGVWLVGQKMGDVFRVYDEICLERSDIASMTVEFRNRYPAHSAELWIYGDATGRRRHQQTGEADFFLVQEYLSGYPAPIRFMLPEVNPPVTDRVSAVNRLLRSPDGRRLVEIASHCKELAADFESTTWKPNRTVNKSGGRRSDGADAFGYWACADSPVPRYASGTRRALRSIRSPGYFQKAPVSGRPFPATWNMRGI